MPQTIPGRALNTLKFPDDAVVTVKYAGGGSARVLTIVNYGPGDVMVSTDPDIVPAFDSTDCFLLKPNIMYSGPPTSGSLDLLLVASPKGTMEVEDTTVSFSFL